MIGYRFMGRAHSNAWRQAPKFFPLKAHVEMHTLCGRNPTALHAARAQLGWQNTSTDWREVVESPLVDIVDINSTNDSHAEIAIAAAQNGKHVLCEKPLAPTLAACQKMLDAARKAHIKHMVGFNYRRVPAVALARQIISAGQLGEIRHFRATYLQDWLADPKFPMNWRLRKDVAGSGAHGDLNAHCIDLARFLVGDITETVGLLETYITERVREERSTGLSATPGKGVEKVTVDDASVFLAKFAASKTVAQGAYGTFEATRLAPGRKNYNRFEINGSEGSLAFCFERMNELEYCDRRENPDLSGFRTILCTQPNHPYVSAWWPPGHVIGYEHTFIHQASDFINGIATNAAIQPDFFDGAKCVAILESVIQSRKNKGWTKVATVK
jgi:predicted dehydrogenase